MSCAVVAVLATVAAANLDEFRIKREQVFEFVQKPRITRDGDAVTIAFETKGFCDVAVAVEDASGRIVRHLVSGVLGPNAPEPLQRDAKKQTVVWDGKDDLGVYMDDKDKLTVRVSLGLKPRFERTLYWSPKKRIPPGNRPNFAAAPEGVYVHEGGGVDHIRLFTHAGEYVRTVYPFPPDYSSPEARSRGKTSMQTALAGVEGLAWIASPMDGLMVPNWQGLFFHTMLTSGSNAGTGTARINPTKYGSAASVMAYTPGPSEGKPGRLALVMRRLNRLATDGTTGGMPLEGPTVTYPGRRRKYGGGWEDIRITPSAGAFSPDGKWLYLTGYGSMHGVVRLDFLGDRPPEVFAGEMAQNRGGAGDNQFRDPISLDIDARGRVYVADYNNDRIQVFTPDGTLHKSIPTPKPARVFVAPKSGHIYVGSWLLLLSQTPRDARAEAVFRHLGPVDDPKQIAQYPLPFARYASQVFMNRTWATHEIWMNFRTDPPTLWVVPGSGDTTEKLMQLRHTFAPGMWQASKWSESHYRLYVEKDGQLAQTANFAKDVARAVGRIDPPSCPAHERQRLYVNPADGTLYVMEGDTGVGKATFYLLRIDPNTGRTGTIRLPIATEEIAFDLDGRIYLRTDIAVGRYDLTTWREVPFDYGMEMVRPGFNGDGAPSVAFIRLPTVGKPGCFHLGGFGVSPTGHILVSCYNAKRLDLRTDGFDASKAQVGRPYTPKVYPGRRRWAEVHIWDKYGRVLHEDAVPGLTMTDGLQIDKDDNVYALWAARRLLPGQNPGDNTPAAKGFLPISSETLVKFKPGKAKVLSLDRADLPLPADMRPGRPPDVRAANGGLSWAEGAEWMYGGVGCDGCIPHWAPNCSCWNARPCLDLYARSFVTELARSRVAVLDTNGNLIMRIGTYGNVDDGVPLVKKGGPANPRSVGGDEVALAKPAYVAAHTDRRLFIADYGNYRILSVKLGYHAEETVPLRDVKEQAAEDGRTAP